MEKYLNADFGVDMDIPVTSNEIVNEEKAHLIAKIMALSDMIDQNKIAEASIILDGLEKETDE